MLNIIIESTEYKKDRGLNKMDISLIKDMGNKKLISLHIPYFVYKECTSSSIADIEIELNKIRNYLKSFNRKGMGRTDYSSAIRIEKQIEKLLMNIENSNKKLWSEFVEDANAILYEFDEKDSVNVFDAYFTGGKPFKSLKSRNDIPDAFIFQTIKKISKNERVHLISGDNNLNKKCVDLKNVITHSNFKEFYNHQDFKEIKLEYDSIIKENERVNEAKKILLDNREIFKDAINKYIHSIDFLEIYGTNLPSDNGEITIYAIDNPEFTIDEQKIEYIDNKFFIPIEIKGIASIDYAIFKADYWVYDNLPSISEDLNKHYFLLEDEVTIIMKKTISINIDEIDEEKLFSIEIFEYDEIEVE